MAVRDDFTAGEVLAAADLNDTFASKLPYSFGTATPTTTDSGFLWYDSNSTPAAPKFWDGAAFVDFPSGLTLVASETLSTVSSVSINNCFTSAFENYRIIFRTTAASGSNTNLLIRLRVSGSDANTSSTYGTQVLAGNGASAIAALSAISTGYLIGFVDTTTALYHGSSTDLYSPAIARPTLLTNISHNYSSVSLFMETRAAYHNQSTAYDGMTLSVASGTISGTLKVYGYGE